MSEFWFNIRLAFEHVLDWNAYDHVLFFILLTISYTISNWKRILSLVTIFTIGHTISLLLSTYNIIPYGRDWIEFFILLTILLVGIYNVFTANKSKNNRVSIFYIITGVFGFIHGLGFSNYLKVSKGFGSEILQVLGFSLGVEIAQILVVFIVLIISFVVQTLFRFSKRDWILVISSIVIGMVIPMIISNKIW